MTQTLAKTEPTALLEAVRTNPIEAIGQQYSQLEKVANVTFPQTAIDAIPPMHKPTPALVKVNLDEKSKDTYYITRDTRGLSKHILLKMLTAAGCQWRTRKLTPDSSLDLIRWTAVIWRRLPDGMLQTGQGSKAWSWSKCQDDFVRKAADRPSQGETPEQAKNRGIKNAMAYREFADEQTETKALLRAARAILNIKTSYSPEELAKPFLFLRIVPDLDLSDPEIKRMVAQKAVDSVFAIYGAPNDSPALPPATPEPPAEPDATEFDEDEVPPEDYPGEAEETPVPEAEAAPALDVDPFKDPPKPEASGAPDCSSCGNAIKETVIQGTRYSDSQIVDLTVAKVGKALCPHCFLAWVQAQRKAGAK